jgi:MoaA/NifB/PqqE/SkfB family radical SAM enzyme
MTYSKRSVWIGKVIRQTMFSLPHYYGELSELRSRSDLRAWAYYKWPFSFPLSAFPPYVTIESTNSCNFTCGHCWRSKMDRPVGFMDVDLFRKIVAELKHYSPITLKVGGTGEPGLHPRFHELMAALNGLDGIRVFVYTNGTLLRRYPHYEILKWNINTMVISADGTDPDSYNRLRPGGDYRLLREQVEDFYALRNELGQKLPKIEIRHVIMPNETVGQLLEVRKSWLKTSDTVKFNHLISLERNEAFSRPPTVCRQIRREFCIEWDGRVRQCGSYPEYLGDLHSSTIEGLWHSPQANFVRDCHQRGDLDPIPACKGCS